MRACVRACVCVRGGGAGVDYYYVPLKHLFELRLFCCTLSHIKLMQGHIDQFYLAYKRKQLSEIKNLYLEYLRQY